MLIRLQVAGVDGHDLEAALAALVALNVTRIERFSLPPLYESGVRYRRERPDEWSTAEVVAQRGWGDCEDLAAWRAAELRLQGIAARATAYRAKGRMWHAVVLYPDGTIEDPSKALGMRGAA